MLGNLVSGWTPLLDFWFGDITEEGIATRTKREQWFMPNPDFDRLCAEQFAPLLRNVEVGALDSWLTDPRGRLAFIVLTDQIPRNIYRGTAQAFAWDDLARRAAKAGISAGADQALAWEERSFYYMPFEHSESIFDQHLAVGLFSQLRDQSPKHLRNMTGNSLRFAQQHRDIIANFGRFPHRNDVLNRKSTAAELAFTAEHGGFGQNTHS